MLIEWQGLGAVVELLEPAVEPVRESRVDAFDRFPHRASGGGSPTATRLQGDGHGNALVEGGGQVDRFTQPGMPHGHNALGIDGGVLNQNINHSAKSPSP